ncbi:MAG: SGNH/GDSL hydrolase family protein [Nodosilinea sp. LVE1205-7]
MVLGSSVALGCSAWLLRGWAWHLGRALQQHYGHQLVNLSEIGTNVSSTIARFSQVVVPQQPDMVIIALSLGNEGLASSSPQQYRAIQRRFENGLQQLVKLVREIGAVPILGAVYPNGGYSSEHYQLLQETHQRLLTWGIPLLDWLGAVDDGTGRWQSGLGFDPAHPNTDGHYQMYEAIDLTLFEFTKADRITPQPSQGCQEQLLYQDPGDFWCLFISPTTACGLPTPAPIPTPLPLTGQHYKGRFRWPSYQRIYTWRKPQALARYPLYSCRMIMPLKPPLPLPRRPT